MDAVSNPVAKRMKPNPQGDDANERAEEQGERPLSLTSNQDPQEPSSTTFVTVDDMAEHRDPTAIAAAVAAASSPPPTSSRDAEGSNQVETLPQYHTTPHYNHDHLNGHDYTSLESKGGVRYSPPGTDPMSFSSVPGVETVAHIDAGEEATAMAAAAAAVPIPGGIEMLQDGAASYFKAGVRQDGMVAHPGVFHHSFYPQPDEHYQDHPKQQHLVQGENENGEEGQQELHQHPSQQQQQQQQQQQEQVDGKESSSHPIMPPLVSGSNISVPMPSMTTILPSSEVLSSSGPSTLLQRPPSHDPSNMYFEGGPRPAHTLSSTDPAYRRKDKSLGVLCANFMRRYSKMTTERPGESTEVTIDEASQSLMVERRRIYDIINILEAIEVVTRKGKNTYNWHGLSNITHTLRKLQQEALELFPDDVVQNQLDKLPRGHSTEPTGFDLLLASAEQVEKPLKRGKEKSLGRLSQKFIMLFLVGNETITLEEASDKILGKTDLPQAPPDATAEEMLKIRNANNKMIKTKIRRLYDIANIMASVGLIAKLHTENQAVGNAPRAKPMFKWIYPLTASEIMAQVDPNGDHHHHQQQQQQQQQQPAEDGLLAHHGVGDVQGAAKTGENDVVENPVALHQQHDQFSYPHQYPNHRHNQEELGQFHHNQYHHNDQQEEQQHQQPYLRQTNTDSNVTYAETNQIAEEGVTNAIERSAALIANSVANNGDDCIHDMEAAAAAEAAVAAFEEGGNIAGQNEDYAGGDQERHEQVAMEGSESIAV